MQFYIIGNTTSGDFFAQCANEAKALEFSVSEAIFLYVNCEERIG